MKRELLDQDREFFNLVARAAFINPFSDERTDLDFKISGCPPGTSIAERFEVVRYRVAEKMRQLEEKNVAACHFYSGDDLYLMRTIFLFDVFYRFIDHFDQLLLDQIEAGEISCRVTFADEALPILIERGLTPSEAGQYFAMFYQLRRAYYFIDRNLIGRGVSMKQLRRHLWNNIFTHDSHWYERYLWNRMEDFSTLLLGETGSGKGMAAAAIGRSGYIPFDAQKSRFSESFARNFITINLSQYSETLIQSELFGHKKGAFSGAIDNHDGLFARCSPYGSIFLDEIGDVSIPIQIMLLKILQERTFSPVGSHEQCRFSGRVIAATNKPIDELREKGVFRDDFFYRLCSDIIYVPPLRQRLREDPHELIDMLSHIVSRIIGQPSPDLVEMVIEVVRKDIGLDYNWPGNVREMEQAVRRILLTRHYRLETGSKKSDLRSRLVAAVDDGSVTAQDLLAGYCQLMYEKFGTYEEVARRLNLDRRTVKKYVQSEENQD